eukprot:s3650_g8.t1
MPRRAAGAARGSDKGDVAMPGPEDDADMADASGVGGRLHCPIPSCTAHSSTGHAGWDSWAGLRAHMDAYQLGALPRAPPVEWLRSRDLVACRECSRLVSRRCWWGAPYVPVLTPPASVVLAPCFADDGLLRVKLSRISGPPVVWEQANLPVHLGGLRLRPAVNVAEAACIGGAATLPGLQWDPAGGMDLDGALQGCGLFFSTPLNPALCLCARLSIPTHAEFRSSLRGKASLEAWRSRQEVKIFVGYMPVQLMVVGLSFGLAFANTRH